MKKYLISACLAGEAVRYNGGHCLKQQIQNLVDQGCAVTICPEIQGGLSTPRAAAEIQQGQGIDVLYGTSRVIDLSGDDVTAAFVKGAYRTLELAQYHQVTHVILKANSPSCGSNRIYDGSFTGHKIKGDGVTAALLKKHGFKVWTEEEFLQHLNEK